MKPELQVHNLPLTCEMMQERGLPVVSVTTNDPKYTRKGRLVRNVVVTWGTEPEAYLKELAEWCVQSVGTVKHVMKGD
jgi:hypothetical protein